MYILIKPHVIRNGLLINILKEIDDEFNITFIKWFTLTKEQVEKLYPHHMNKNYSERIIAAMIRGPSVLVTLENDQHSSVRKLCRQIREDYPKQSNQAENYVHCPDQGNIFKELDLLCPKVQK